MGAWGAGIFENDAALDARLEFQELIDEGVAPDAAADRILAGSTEIAEDWDDGPMFYLALASLLIDNGVRRHPAIDAARRIATSGEGLESWEAADDETRVQRGALYRELAERFRQAAT